jgi:hypothetical protein
MRKMKNQNQSTSSSKSQVSFFARTLKREHHDESSACSDNLEDGFCRARRNCSSPHALHARQGLGLHNLATKLDRWQPFPISRKISARKEQERRFNPKKK